MADEGHVIVIWGNMMRRIFSFFWAIIFFSLGIGETSAKRIIHTRPSEYISWGVDPNNTSSNINLALALEKFEKKRDVVIGVIDTGVAPGHPYIRSNLHFPGARLSSTRYGVDFSQKNRANSYTPQDSHGHGTHVKGIIKSVFPGVKLLVLKYFDEKADGPSNFKATIKALKYAVDQNVDIINYSSGGPESSPEEFEILKRAKEKGILVVAAAGNEGSNIDLRARAYYIASYRLDNILTVMAYDKNLNVVPSSNWGKRTVHIAAPGHQIKSSLPPNRAGKLTGTSQATAFVSGAAGRLLAQFPNLKRNLKDIILASAKTENAFKGKCMTGGRLDMAKAQATAFQYSRGKQKYSGTMIDRKHTSFLSENQRRWRNPLLWSLTPKSRCLSPFPQAFFCRESLL